MIFRRNPEESNLIRYIKNDDIDSFQLLVDSIINVNYKFSIFTPSLDEYLRFSPSLLAVSAYYSAVQIFRYLLLNGADLTIKDKRNISITHFAVYGGNFEILHLLDEYGAPFDGTLFTAAERGLEDIFKWILYYKSEDLHQRRKDGTNLVDASSKGGNWKLTTFILELIKDDLTITEAFRLIQLMKESKYNKSDDSDYEYEENNSDNDNDSDINGNDHEDSDNKVNKKEKLSNDNDHDYNGEKSENESDNYDETENDESESESGNNNENKNAESDDNSENTDEESTNADNESSDTDRESDDDDESDSTQDNDNEDESKSEESDSDYDTDDSKNSDNNIETEEKSSITD